MRRAGPNFGALQNGACGLSRTGTPAIFCLLLPFLFFMATVFLPRSAQAQCEVCACNEIQHEQTRAYIVSQTNEDEQYIAQQFDLYRGAYLGFYFGQDLGAALKMMTEQLVSTGMLQIEAFGAMYDAQNQLETQQMLQEMEARAHKDYQTDTEMCTLGTSSRGLGSSYRNGQLVAHILARRMQDRILGNGESMGGGGYKIDQTARYEQVLSTYCDPRDQAQAMAAICNRTGANATTDRDLSFMETVTEPQTIAGDFTDGNATNGDKQHILALTANLFANTTFDYFQNQAFHDPLDQATYLDIREVAARRDVAEFSMASVIGQKISDNAPGDTTGAFVAKVYAQMGLTDQDSRTETGQRPSYYALMEMMNKTLYLRPDFYVDLYTTPANVERIGATIKAANTMQAMDSYNSQLRTEMDMSEVLEDEIDRQQGQVEGRIDRLRTQGASQNVPPS
jgi:hypothetical protein